MKKFGTILGVIVAVAVVAFGGYALGVNHGSSKTSSSSSSSSVSVAMSSSQSSSSVSSSSSSAKAVNPEASNIYDPNKTLDGQTIDNNMIQTVTSQLKAAGLPANQWSSSDIKQIISLASQRGVSPVDYAKQNYHQ